MKKKRAGKRKARNKWSLRPLFLQVPYCSRQRILSASSHAGFPTLPTLSTAFKFLLPDTVTPLSPFCGTRSSFSSRRTPVMGHFTRAYFLGCIHIYYLIPRNSPVGKTRLWFCWHIPESRGCNLFSRAMSGLTQSSSIELLCLTLMYMNVTCKIRSTP